MAGIIQWKPAQFPYTADYYARYTSEFFDVSKPSGFFWRSHQALCPQLDKFTASFKTDTVNTSAGLTKKIVRVRSNLTRTERTLLRNAQDRQVGFNNSDKNFGPVLYSCDLYLRQYQTHLFDTKGTYECTAKPTKMILQDIARRLKNLLNDCFGKESTTKSFAHTLTKWADDSVKLDRLANFQ